MEFPFDINRLFSQRISILDHTLFAEYSKSVKMTGSMSNLATVVDELGRASAVAQNLHAPITTAAKMHSQKHQIYLLTERQKNDGRGVVVGFLKVGYKKLFLHDTHGTYVEAKPLCVLDFYVAETLQRRGYGLELFEFMLQHKNLKPVLVAYDGPTPKFLSFLAKHYCLTNIVSQFNNFVVFDGFFHNKSLDQFKKISLKKPDGDIKSFSLPERRIVLEEHPYFSPQCIQQNGSSQWTNGLGVGRNRVHQNQISSIFGDGNKSPQPSLFQNSRGDANLPFDINQLFPHRISILDQMVFASAKTPDQLVHLSMVLDELGRASAAAQQLKSPVTSAAKLKSQKHHIYLLKESELNGGYGVVLGFLKVGYKKLFLHDKQGVYIEAEPLCILDFYIVETFQRRGYGLELFNYMLQHKNLEPRQLAYDGPTPPFMAFLAKHYCLTESVPQANNFLVFRGFFHKRTGTPQRKAEVKKSEGEIKHSVTKMNVVQREQPTQIRSSSPTSTPSTPTPVCARKGKNNARQPSPLAKNTTEETKSMTDSTLDYNQLFPERITVVDHTLFAEKSSQKQGLSAHVGTIIDELGKASAEARKLRVPLTSAVKLKSQKHQIYLLKEGENHGGHGTVLGMLKVGNKKLFLRDKQGVYIEAEPLCVFDFFIVEKFQRCGYGLELFDYMLQHKNSEPVEIVYDRPTPKFLSFLAKHYCLTQAVPQTNNVVVFEGFFNTQCPACRMLVNQRHLRSQATKASRPSGKRNVSLTK